MQRDGLYSLHIRGKETLHPDYSWIGVVAVESERVADGVVGGQQGAVAEGEELATGVVAGAKGGSER